MAILTPAERINRAGSLVAAAISPAVAVNAPTQGEADSWLPLFEAADKVDGRSARPRSMADVRVLLQVLTRYWKHFRQPTKPSQTRSAVFLLDTLNRAAHVPAEITLIHLTTFLGTAHDLARSLGADPAVIAEINRQHLDAAQDHVTATAAADGADAPGQTRRQAEPEVLTATAPPSPQPESTVPHSVTAASEDKRAGRRNKDREEELIERFYPYIPGSPEGLDCSVISAGHLHVVVFYRRDLNFALTHNRVSVFAGMGAVWLPPEPEPEGTAPELKERTRTVTGLRAQFGPGLSAEQVTGSGPAEAGAGTTAWEGPQFSLSPGEEWHAEPSDLAWNLPPAQFARVEEATETSIELHFDLDGAPVSRSIPIRVLAHDEWTPTAVPEIIAAFVRPRAEAVRTVISTASDLLAERTGSPSIVGYQEDSERVVETARALYDAVRSLEIRYSEPPASFERHGQKIRTSDTVVRDRFGTCLDTTVLFAAALEEAGLHAYVLLLKGHAMVGFARREITTEMVVSEPGTLSNLFGSNVFVPIETTVCTAGSSASFDDAVRAGFIRCADGRAVRAAVSIQAAHRRIRPLPAIVEGSGDRTIVVVENRAGRDRVVTADLPPADRVTGETKHLLGEQLPYRVQRWRSDLLDLSFRNPLLRLSDSRGLSFILADDDLGPLEDRLAGNQSVPLTPHDHIDPIDLQRGLSSAAEYDSVQLSRLFREEARTYVRAHRSSTLNKLTRLRREAKTIREDTGANALYVSLGLLKWKSAGQGSTVKEGRSPLFLLPVELKGSRTRPYSIHMEPNAEVQANQCLIEKLRQEYGLVLPQLENPPADDAGIDLAQVFRELRELFLEKGLDFSVESRAHLAILQFATLDMWRDVGENWESLAHNPVVGHFVHRPSELFTDAVESRPLRAADEADSYLPVPADGSQLEAIKAASAGASFVLEGPPGTGKSQTITNMIADGLARGRTILFVAEKQAALSVVHDRLRRIGLEPLTLNVHGKDQSINLIREQIRQSIQADPKGNAAAFDAQRGILRTRIEDLGDYPARLHDGGTGATIWDRYQHCLLLEQNRQVPADWNPEDVRVGAETLQLGPRVLQSLANSVHHAARAAVGSRLPHAWSFIGDLQGSGSPGAEEPTDVLLTCAREVTRALDDLPRPLSDLLDRMDAEQTSRLEAWLADLPSGRAVLPHRLGAPRMTAEDLHARTALLEGFLRRWATESPRLTRDAMHADVDRLQSELDTAVGASLFRRGRLTQNALGKITALASEDHRDWVTQDPQRFLTQLRTLQRDHAETRARLAHGIGGLEHADLFDPGVAGVLAQQTQDARDYEAHAALTRAFLQAVPDSGTVLDALVQADPTGALQGRLGQSVERFRTAWTGLCEASGATASSLRAWQGEHALLARIRECTPIWLETEADQRARHHFQRQVELHQALRALTDAGLRHEAEAIHAGHGTSGLAEAVILAVERQNLEAQLRDSRFDVFSPEDRAGQVEQYIEISRDLKLRMRSELPARLMHERRTAARVSVGLRKEIDRKRGGSIRQLFEHYGQEILNLTPVVLMSPASVARFLPADQPHFDTVIFDEASQVKVADAIGALGRADAAVIVGDSKQMPPSSLFNGDGGSAEDEELAPAASEDTGVQFAATDQESILSEAVSSGLLQRWLSWHYRSQHESLISFSNMKYYSGELNVFPGPPEERPGLGIRAVFVGGTFERGRTRTNSEEAEAIVDDITSRLATDPQASLGVVTFNMQQRDLILDRLEQSGSAAVQRALERDTEPLFVKNLENVQGDERDVILFSIAFAKDPETGVLSHNFGPLNASGGERRLNVAVTRARRQVVLFTSLRSIEIDPRKTRAEGLLHLKEYLAYAEHGTLHASSGAQQFESVDLYRRELLSALRAEGLEVVEDIGTSRFRVDLAVRAGTDLGWLALVLDSPEWASRLTTADRESLPSEILQRTLGWQDTMQVYLPAWIGDPGAVVRQIKERAQSLVPQPKQDSALPAEGAPGPPHLDSAVHPHTASEETSGPDDAQSPDVVSHADHDIDPLAPMRSMTAAEASIEQKAAPVSPADRSGQHPFIEASDEQVHDQQCLDGDLTPEVRGLVREELRQIIELEGPVEESRLVRIVVRRFGRSRITEAVRKKILDCTPYSPAPDSEKGRCFYWPEGLNPETYSGYRPRSPEEGTVDVHEISIEELANAMLAELSETGPMPTDSLLRETMAVFGWARLRSNIRSRLERALKILMYSKRVRLDNELIALTDPGQGETSAVLV